MNYIIHTELTPEELAKRHYAFPEQRKFPLPDRAHILSAIKFFNYVDPKDERHLANAILQRMRELGVTNVYVGPNNRFGKYYKEEPDSLTHYGKPGMHWGEWNDETRERYLNEGHRDPLQKKHKQVQQPTSGGIQSQLQVAAQNSVASDHANKADWAKRLVAKARHRKATTIPDVITHSDFLAHYGVKGMHWGVWNAETAARHAGRRAERYREKAYNARKKAQSLDRMAFGRSSSIQRAKYKAKASKYTKRANRSDWHPFQSPYERARNQRKAQKYKRMAEGLSGKVAKVEALEAKADRYEFKAEKAERAKKRYLSSISKSNLATGRNLVNNAMEARLDSRVDHYVRKEAGKAQKEGRNVDARYRAKLRAEGQKHYYGQ